MYINNSDCSCKYPSNQRTFTPKCNQSEIPSIFPDTVVYANAYVPFQQTTTLFEPAESLCNGTIFKELFHPYHGKGEFLNE